MNQNQHKNKSIKNGKYKVGSITIINKSSSNFNKLVFTSKKKVATKTMASMKFGYFS